MNRPHRNHILGRLAAPVLAALLLGSVAFVTQTVVNRGFYAMQNTLLPAAFGTLTVIVSIPLYYAGMTWWGLKGVGLAVSLSAMAQVVVLYTIWNRRSHNDGSRDVYGFFFKMLLLSIPLGATLALLRRGLVNVFDPGSACGCFLIAAIASAVFLLLLFALACAFKIPEFTVLLQRLRTRFQRPD